MSEALNTREQLEEQTSALYKAIEGENEPHARKRLVLELDEVIGERLVLEADHVEEFCAYDKQWVES